MILHAEDFRYLLRLLGKEGAELQELAEYYELMGRNDRRDKALAKLNQIHRLGDVFRDRGKSILSTVKGNAGRPRKGCGKAE